MSTMTAEQQTTRKPIRVLMVTGHYPTERNPHSNTFIKTQVDSLDAAGLEVEVIHPKSGLFLFRYISTAIRVFLRALTGRFDVVHGHYGQWALIARMQLTTPTVVSFLGSDLLGVVTADGRYSKKGALIEWISRWLCHRVDAVIVKSEEMRKATKATSADNIFVIPSGVDFELFHPIPRLEARAALGWDQDRYYVLFGNDPQIPRKNYALAQAAIECLSRRGMSAELVVANRLPQTTVVQYINASNALILPSIHEGSPNVVKETMACNVPIVATNVGDVLQVIGHTEGCKVCPCDPEALAAALEEALLYTQPTTGRTDIAHLDRSVVARQVIAIYEKVISKKSQRLRNKSLLLTRLSHYKKRP